MGVGGAGDRSSVWEVLSVQKHAEPIQFSECTGKLAAVVVTYNPSAAHVETGRSLGLDGQPSLLGEPQAEEMLCLKTLCG